MKAWADMSKLFAASDPRVIERRRTIERLGKFDDRNTAQRSVDAGKAMATIRAAKKLKGEVCV